MKIFVVAVRKWEILAATKVKMSGRKKSEQELINRYDISSVKRVTRKFLEVSRCSRVKQLQRNVQKKVCCTWKAVFLLEIETYCFFFSPFSLPSPPSITWFYILFEQLTRNIIKSFAFSPCWIYTSFLYCISGSSDLLIDSLPLSRMTGLVLSRSQNPALVSKPAYCKTTTFQASFF